MAALPSRDFVVSPGGMTWEMKRGAVDGSGNASRMCAVKVSVKRGR